MENIFRKAKWKKMYGYKVNRKYKDSLFRFVFNNKNDLLELYNAINGTEYSDPEDLSITTLEDVVYLGFKNDISFLIGYDLNLYEHQSTWNPNMPLRGFFYFSDMYKGYIEQNDLNIYSSGRVRLPVPKYIVFYNGEKKEPDEQIIRLSDSFDTGDRETCALECRATLLNINYGHNREIMQKCKRLSDYSYFVQAVKLNLQKGFLIKDAIDKAVEECIKKDILADILRKNRAEVRSMLLTVYDEKKYKKALREEARAEGREEGRAEGREEGRAEGRKEGREEGREEGRAEGREEGRKEGKEELNELYRRLLSDDREADMKRAIMDSEYREVLLKEYEID